MASAVREAEVLAQAAETAKAAYLHQESQRSQPDETIRETVSSAGSGAFKVAGDGPPTNFRRRL